MEQDRRRNATSLELFYDLAFVVEVAVLGEMLYDNVSWTELAMLTGLRLDPNTPQLQMISSSGTSNPSRFQV